jgi:cephalosporin-C deacetylase-like acetyl esterase
MKGASGFMIGLLTGLMLFCAALARGEEGPAERHQRLLQFLKKTAAEISDRSLSHIQRLEDWNRQRPVIRSQLLSMLGLEPLPKRTPLKVRITGTLQRPNYRIEKVVFQSLPGLYVTANLYVPHAPSRPLPTILYACGHSPHPLGAKWDYQDRAAWFAEHGYVCFILDTLEFGEVPGIHHGIHDLNMWDWLSLGYTPIGVEVWNAIRALDYLETRPEVDRHRIGMTGISGGGSATWFTAAVDERIAAAVPVCSTYTFGSQAAHWVAAGQCDCIYYHNTYLTDFPIVGALIAPRPLLICSGRKDGDFPPDGYHEVYRRVQRIYDLYTRPEGAPEQIKEVDDDVGHTDAPLFRTEARQWMNRWLKGDDTPLPTAPDSVNAGETAENLACLSELPADAVNYKIHDLFIPAAVCKSAASLEAWEQRRQRLMQELKEKVFRWFPQEKIPFETRVGGNDGGWAARYAEYKEVVFDSEAGVPIRAQLLRPRNRSTETPLLIYVKRPGDSIYFLDLDELLPLLGRCTVLILNPRLTEHPVSAFEVAEIERTASWIGRTVAGMQVWDILRAVEWIVREEKLSPASISLYGKGDMGILALYAGLFDARIQRVILKDPPASHRNGAALLNVLRITDIPEVAGAFAPRRLVFLREVPPAFNSARRLYKLCGCPDHLTYAGSLPEALDIWKQERSH